MRNKFSLNKLMSIGLVCFVTLSGCGESTEKSAIGDSGATASSELEIIATGANIAGANGLAIGPDGNLYVTSVLGSTISVINPESGEIVKTYGSDDGVIGPDDVDFFADGSWFWTSIMTGQVAGFDADGKLIEAAQLTPGVNPITFSNDGRLFVSQCFFGTNLYEVDPLGKSEARLISDELGPGCGLNGMDWGPDNRLYGPRWFNQEVVSFNVDTNTKRTEAKGFDTPAAVKFDSDGQLHVLDTGAGTIYKVEDGQNISVAELSPGLDNFVIDEQGRFFVTSFADGFVKRVNRDKSVTELQPGGMAHAGGIAYFKGNVVAADLHAIRAYKTNGDEAFVQRNVLGTGKMGGALNVAADGEDLILTSWVDNDVRIWNQQDQAIKWRKTELLAPVSAARYGDLIVVAEHGKQRVIGVDVNGEVVAIFAEALPAPTGLAVEGGALYVSDRTLGQILKLAENGDTLAKPQVVIDGLDSPEGFVWYNDKVAIIEADPGRVTLVDSDGGKVHLADVPPGSQAASDFQPPSQVFNGITADDEGNLYIPGETNRVLYKLSNPF